MEENNMLDKEFKDLVLYAKQDILRTRYEVQENANMELIRLYFRLGKIVSENAKYGNNFIKDFSIALKLEFPDSTGFSTRNLSRMKKFYEEYKDLSNLPPAVAKLPWTHNCILLEKVKDDNIRNWYAEKCIENGLEERMKKHKRGSIGATIELTDDQNQDSERQHEHHPFTETEVQVQTFRIVQILQGNCIRRSTDRSTQTTACYHRDCHS